MIFKIDDLKNIASKILFAIDRENVSDISDYLEIRAESGSVIFNLTNSEYFLKIKLPIITSTSSNNFRAVVNAGIFLKLINQITSETVDIRVNKNYLEVEGNGEYKLPLIFKDSDLLELPEITIENVVSTTEIEADALNSIYTYNSKEILNPKFRGAPAQSLYYLDKEGVITFTQGACINTFTINTPVKLLLTPKLVKLFRLFKSGAIKVTIGQDTLFDNLIQTKVRFESEDTVITSALPSDLGVMNSVPATAIRQRANDIYPYNVVIPKAAFMQLLNRISLLNKDAPYIKVDFYSDFAKVYTFDEDNSEDILYKNVDQALKDTSYNVTLDIAYLKNIISSYTGEVINITLGNNEALVLSYKNIKNIIPEVLAE